MGVSPFAVAARERKRLEEKARELCYFFGYLRPLYGYIGKTSRQIQLVLLKLKMKVLLI